MTAKKPAGQPGLAAAIASMPGAAANDSHNKFAGYDYASADSIYQTARRSLAENGLAVWQNELSFDMLPVGDKQWIRAQFAMALTPDGMPPEHEPEVITVMCQAVGAQSFAAIRTYALKYWLRGKCLLATGDLAEDVDSTESDAPPALPQTKVQKASETIGKATGKWGYDPKLHKFIESGEWATNDARLAALYRAFRSKLVPTQDHELANMIVGENMDLIAELPQKGQDDLERRLELHQDALAKQKEESK